MNKLVTLKKSVIRSIHLINWTMKLCIDFYIYIYIYICVCGVDSWWNRFRRRKWVKLFVFHVTLMPSGKLWIQVFSLVGIWSWRKKKLNQELLNYKLTLKIKLVSHAARAEKFVYIYIFANQLSTSIHSYQEKRQKTRQEQEIKISRITARGKKLKNIIGQKKEKRQTPSHQLKKVKRYGVSWSKEK